MNPDDFKNTLPKVEWRAYPVKDLFAFDDVLAELEKTAQSNITNVGLTSAIIGAFDTDLAMTFAELEVSTRKVLYRLQNMREQVRMLITESL